MSEDSAEGVLFGLACGDALGRPVEFRSAQRIADRYGRLTEMVGHGTWNKPAGTVTDDTDLARCIAESVVECGGFDPEDVAERFVEWYEAGPFDVGRMTARSIRRLKRGDSWETAGQTVWENSREGQNAGNGSVMRCAPLAIPYAAAPDELVQVSRQSSQITHADPRCTWGCALLNCTIAACLDDVDAPLDRALEQVGSDLPGDLAAAIEELADGDEPESLETSGYVVHTLQTALHDALTADSAEDAIVTVVNRGGDADTIGAVAGAVAGARFGASDLPERWLDAIDETDTLHSLAVDLQTLEVD